MLTRRDCILINKYLPDAQKKQINLCFIDKVKRIENDY